MWLSHSQWASSRDDTHQPIGISQQPSSAMPVVETDETPVSLASGWSRGGELLCAVLFIETTELEPLYIFGSFFFFFLNSS